MRPLVFRPRLFKIKLELTYLVVVGSKKLSGFYKRQSNEKGKYYYERRRGLCKPLLLYATKNRWKFGCESRGKRAKTWATRVAGSFPWSLDKALIWKHRLVIKNDLNVHDNRPVITKHLNIRAWNLINAASCEEVRLAGLLQSFRDEGTYQLEAPPPCRNEKHYALLCHWADYLAENGGPRDALFCDVYHCPWPVWLNSSCRNR